MILGICSMITCEYIYVTIDWLRYFTMIFWNFLGIQCHIISYFAKGYALQGDNESEAEAYITKVFKHVYFKFSERLIS